MADSQGYRLTMSTEGYEALADLATKRGQSMADLMRTVLQQHLHENGYTVSLAVKRGGDRRGMTKADQDVSP